MFYTDIKPLLRVENLPFNPPQGVALMCRTCGERYSATRGDYFLNNPHEVLRCATDGEPMELVRQQTVYTDWPEQPQHTPNGYDPAWIGALNGVLADRGADTRITDITTEFWDRYLGPACDAIEDSSVRWAVYKSS